MSRFIVSMLALLVAGPALAQAIGEPIPGRGASAKAKAAPSGAQRAARPCPEYGPGFVRVDGSAFCVRAGGSVRAEFGKVSGGGYGSSASGVARLEARSETEFGQVRIVAQKRLQSGNWPERGPYR